MLAMESPRSHLAFRRISLDYEHCGLSAVRYQLRPVYPVIPIQGSHQSCVDIKRDSRNAKLDARLGRQVKSSIHPIFLSGTVHVEDRLVFPHPPSLGSCILRPRDHSTGRQII